MYRIDCADCGKAVVTESYADVELFGLAHYRVTLDPNSDEMPAHFGSEPLVCPFGAPPSLSTEEKK